MSHSLAQVIYDGRIIGYSEYNGTVDTMQWNSWYDTDDEMLTHWGELEKSRPWLDHCQCAPVDAFVYSAYGDGFHWPAKICLEHKVILGRLTPWDDETDTGSIDGHPLGHEHPFIKYLKDHLA